MTDSSDSIERSVNSVTSSLLEAAKRGDDQAWERLQKTYGRLVCWWCARANVPADEIDEIAQEVFKGLVEALPGFEHKSFRGYLWRITRNKICDFWRAKERTPLAGGSTIEQILDNVQAESSRGVGSADQATKILFDGIVEFVKGEFSERDWQAFWLYAVEGKDMTEVTGTLNINANQVHLAKSRILRRIRQEFGDEFPS